MTVLLYLLMLVIANPVYDFGKINDKNEVTHNFEVKNKTNQKIKILNISTSCSCTVADYPESFLPGRKGYIKISFNPKGLNGQITRKIIVITDSDNPYILLTISAFVIPKN